MPDRPPREVRFVRTELEPLLHTDSCRVRVHLVRPPMETFVGTADGSCEGADALRCAANAAADALRKAMGPADVTLEIQDINLVRGVGLDVVMVSVGATYDNVTRQLVGVCPGREDAVRAAALAVLNATNRFLGVG